MSSPAHAAAYLWVGAFFAALTLLSLLMDMKEDHDKFGPGDSPRLPIPPQLVLAAMLTMVLLWPLVMPAYLAFVLTINKD